jgi:hypothetical protein
MVKHICFKMIIAFMLSGLWMGTGMCRRWPADVEFSKAPRWKVF